MAPSMRAAQYDNGNKKVVVHNVSIPEPKDGQVQVKIIAASLCHSDLMHYQRPKKSVLTIGHEALGRVSKVHSSAEGKGFKVGDTVGMHCVDDSCWDCEGCRVHSTFCVKPKNGFAKIAGIQSDGYFAEYCVTDYQNLVQMPTEGLPVEKMSPLFCAGITSFHAVDKCELEPGQWIAIVGCGGLGQMAIRYAKAMKLKVVCIDLNDRILERVKNEGADATFNPKTNPQFYKDIRRLTGRRGCHAAAVFSDAVQAYDTAYRSLGIDGVLMVVGLPQKPIQIPAFAISLGMIRVRGGSNGKASEMKKAVDFTAKHKIIPDVEFRKLEDMPQMMEELEQGKLEKRQVVVFENSKSKM